MARDELAGAAGASEARIDAFETDNAMPMFRQLGLIGKSRWNSRFLLHDAAHEVLRARRRRFSRPRWGYGSAPVDVGNASGGAAPKGCAETGAHGDVPRVHEEGITELASDVVEDLSGTAETVAENLKVSTLAAGVRLKALGLISDANLEGVRVEVIGSGNLGGKNGRRRKEGRLLRGTVSETWTPSLSSRGRNARRRDARGQRRGTCGQQRETRGQQRGTCGQQKGRS